MVGAGVGLAAFAALSVAVGFGYVRGVDEAALRAVRELRTGDVLGLATFFSFAGKTEVLGSAIVVLASALGLTGRGGTGARLLAAAAVTASIELLMKLYLPQSVPPGGVGVRPAEAPIIGIVYAHSYPSGHALRGTLLLGALFLLAGSRGGRPRLGVAATPVRAVLGVLLVCLLASRLALEVHWASDVLGGALLGMSGVLWAFDADARMRGRIFSRKVGTGRASRKP